MAVVGSVAVRYGYSTSNGCGSWCAPRVKRSATTSDEYRAGFDIAGQEYALWVTDPGFERAYLAKPNGIYDINESYLAVSLGEPYQDACYKLIAAIISAT